MTEPYTFHAAGRLVDFMRQASEPGLINLAAGIPSPESLPSRELATAFQKAFADDGDNLFAYHHPDGDHRLRELLAERMTRNSASVQAKDILTVTGCQQALQLMLSVLIKPGDIVACQVPIYYAMLELISAAGARILPLPERNGDGIDIAETVALLERWQPKCLFVCTTLSNPTGSTMPEASRAQLVSECRRLGVRIIEDDIYAELADTGAPKPMRSYDDGTTVSYVTSFSKTVSPGLRAGYCVPGTIFEQAATLKCQQDMHSSVVSESILRAFIEAGELDPHLARIRERNFRRRKIATNTITKAFPDGSKIWPVKGGYMLWVELPSLVDMASIRDSARKEGVVFAGGRVFFPDEPDASYLRLNTAKANEIELVRGLEILGAACGA